MDKRAFGVIPNYRTADASLPYEPISASHKLVIGLKDSFDGPTFPVAAVFATIHQAENDNPSFGQGMAGWARRFGTAIGDQVICNMMTESFMPMLLRQDPRYFRIGKGTSAWHRAAYALTRIFVTRNDSGKRSFNYSEIVGNAIGATIANAYYPDGRHLSDNVERLGIQCFTDGLSQMAKEFWPDVKHMLFHRHEAASQPLVSTAHPLP